MPNTPTAAEIGSNVKAEMARRGVTQAVIASSLSLSQPQVSARLRGVVTFRIDELLTVAAVLDVPLDSLLGEATAA